MGLFSRKRVVGNMRLDFLSKNEIVVADNIPDTDGEIPYPLWFAFLYAGKLLSNFPGSSGQAVVDRAIVNIRDHVDLTDPFAHNHTMLGAFSGVPLRMVDNKSAGRWVYTGELFFKGDNLLVSTAIARGEEEHFHCAAIDTVFEVVRLRLGKKGGAVPHGVLGYLSPLSIHGCSNVMSNLQYAASAAMKVAVTADALR